MTPINKYRVNLSTSFFKLLKPTVIVILTILCHHMCACMGRVQEYVWTCTPDSHSSQAVYGFGRPNNFFFLLLHDLFRVEDTFLSVREPYE